MVVAIVAVVAVIVVFCSVVLVLVVEGFVIDKVEAVVYFVLFYICFVLL